MGFILWIKGGYLDFLEGYTFADSTVDLDLKTLKFKLTLQ